MLVAFSPIFVVVRKIIVGYNFLAPLIHTNYAQFICFRGRGFSRNHSQVLHISKKLYEL